MRQQLFRIYWALERWIAPGVESSQNTYARLVKGQVSARTRWLDLGCGHQLWPEWVPGQLDTVQRAGLVVGVDPDFASLRQNRIVPHRVVGLRLPFRDGSFDLVTANMVFEHLEHPVDVLREIRRVLTPDGVCIFHTTNAGYWQTALGRHVPQSVKNRLVRVSEGRDAADVYPTHYRINTEQAVHEGARSAGFDPGDVMMLNTSSAGRILLLGPLVVLELLWIRWTRHHRLRRHRTNIIAVLRPRPPRAERRHSADVDHAVAV